MSKRIVMATLAVAVVAAAGCEDITNPIEETGQLAPAWVGFEAPRSVNGARGSWLAVRYGGLTLRPERDVSIDLEFGGSAAFGEDFEVVEGEGSTTEAAGFSAAGGTVLLEYDPAQEAPLDTLWVYIPATAAVDAVLDITLSGAETVEGDPIGVGYLGDFATYKITVVRAPAEIPTGAYAGTVTGDFGSGAIPAVTITAGPVTVAGAAYDYVLSDFAYGLFGEPIPWAFTVYVDGTVSFSPSSPASAGITANASGSYDFDTSTLTMDVELTCCGGEGGTWTTVYTLQ